MSRSVNQIFLIGRLVADVELRATTTGKNVASFTIAVDKSSGEGADFFEVTAWEKLAELLEQYTKKGSKIHVQGRLQQQTWEQDGKKRSKVTITASDVSFLDARPEATEPTPSAKSTKKDTVKNVDDGPVNLDDVPF